MQKIILSVVAVTIAVGGIWLVSSRPQAQEHLRTEAATLKMDIEQMTRKATNLPATVVESFM